MPPKTIAAKLHLSVHCIFLSGKYDWEYIQNNNVKQKTHPAILKYPTAVWNCPTEIAIVLQQGQRSYVAVAQPYIYCCTTNTKNMYTTINYKITVPLLDLWMIFAMNHFQTFSVNDYTNLRSYNHSNSNIIFCTIS